MANKITFYGDSISGNCFKLKHVCAELEIEYDWKEMDILSGAARTKEFRALNPNAKVPLMVLPDGRSLPESNAIISWLADGSVLSGTDRYDRANVLRWLFFEQYSHEPYIATSRFIVRYLGSPEDRQEDLDAKKKPGYRALGVMEKALASSDYLVAGEFSIADIALFAYTHVAHEGGFDLAEYPAIRNWIERIQNRDRFVAM